MRVVITGALGHIGSELIRQLPAACPDTEIVMVDNLATDRYASLFDLPPAGRYEFVEADILDADLERIFAGADAVIHLAAVTHGSGAEAERRMERVNLAGTARVARACLAADAALFFPSTTSVYGVHGVVTEQCPVSELRPQSRYAEWKLQSEAELHALAQSDGLRMVIFRMGSIFGPSVGMRFHTAVNQFCWRAQAGRPIEVWQTASHQFRPYLDLRDAVRALLFVLSRHQFDGRVYNVLTLNATVNHVIEVLAMFAPGLRIAYVDSPLMNTLSYCADNGRFTRLGFEFSGSLERGIRETIAMLRATPRRDHARIG
jgi:nucleoside-diphosphate-sugar epimerase